jgi:hypothetical protein
LDAIFQRRRQSFRRTRPDALALLLGLVLAACAGPRADPTAAVPQGAAQNAALVQPSQSPSARPRIVTPKRRLQCVPYARELSRLDLRGDAWTWWDQAKGRYRRGQRPAVGSVLVLRRKGGSRGHLAVVTRILGEREIVASHANWLNRGQIHVDTPIRDVSHENDWSAVRVWYTPGEVLGKSVYPAYGFIYPTTRTAAQ